MTVTDFISKLDVVFETTDLSTITPETSFKKLDEWDSMLALSLIALADEEYQVRLTGEDIRNSSTIEDLYNKIKAKK